MPARPDGLDQSWGYTDPAVAKREGIHVVSMYLSWDPSKNITPAKVKAYHKAGIAVLLNWESMAGAPRNGAAQGHEDATEAARQAKALIAAVGYRPKNRVAIYFSCDFDAGSNQLATVAAYYQAARDVCTAAGFHVGVYGEADVVDYLASRGITQAEWQTYAWSGGRVSSYADFFQYQNSMSMGGADVDFDQVLHPWKLGAWWPPGNPHDSRPLPAPEPPAPAVQPPAPHYDPKRGSNHLVSPDGAWAAFLGNDGRLDRRHNGTHVDYI